MMPILNELKKQAIKACHDDDLKVFTTEADRLAAVEAYLDAGGDVDTRDPEDDDTLLVNASWRGYMSVVRCLVSHNADVHADDDYAIQCAAATGHLDVVRYLVKHDADIHAGGDYALRASARHGHFDVVRYLVSHNADVHSDDDYAIQRAAKNGHFDVIRYLVSHGANIYATDSDGDGLFDCYTRNQPEIRTYLEAVKPVYDRLTELGVVYDTHPADYTKLMEVAPSIRGIVDALSKDDLLKLASNTVREKTHGRNLL